MLVIVLCLGSCCLCFVVLFCLVDDCDLIVCVARRLILYSVC